MRRTAIRGEYHRIEWGTPSTKSLTCVLLPPSLSLSLHSRLTTQRDGQAERRALEAKHEFDHVSKLVKSEMSRFEKERVDDFKDSLHAFLEGMISRQKEVRGVYC